jgi:hypothetical protein
VDCCANLKKGIKSDDGSTTRATWRADIDALMFWIAAHSASCAVHRRAFRTLMRRDPTSQECLTYFGGVEDAFRAAAAAKITRNQIPAGTNLHLTSRDVARKLIELSSAQRGDEP